MILSAVIVRDLSLVPLVSWSLGLFGPSRLFCLFLSFVFPIKTKERKLLFPLTEERFLYPSSSAICWSVLPSHNTPKFTNSHIHTFTGGGGCVNSVNNVKKCDAEIEKTKDIERLKGPQRPQRPQRRRYQPLSATSLGPMVSGSHGLSTPIAPPFFTLLLVFLTSHCTTLSIKLYLCHLK